MRRFKAFTLVELVIVMVLMCMIMAGAIQMFRPLQMTFTDSTYLENQRTTQNGIVRFFTENLRFATDMMIFTDNGSFSPGTIMNDIQAHYAEMYPPNGPNALAGIRNFRLIIIDNTDEGGVTYNGVTHRGRIYTTVIDATAAGINFRPQNNGYNSSSIASMFAQWNGTGSGSSSGTGRTMRMALGKDFYGEQTYSIWLLPNSPRDNGSTSLEIRVSSILTRRRGQDVQTNQVGGRNHVITNGEIELRNLQVGKGAVATQIRLNNGNQQRIFEYPMTGPINPNFSPTTAAGTRTIILYTLPGDLVFR